VLLYRKDEALSNRNNFASAAEKFREKIYRTSGRDDNTGAIIRIMISPGLRPQLLNP